MIDAVAFGIADEVLRGARPPAPPPSHYDVAKTMRLGGGRLSGRLYDPDSDACQRKVLQTLDAATYLRIALCGPPQVGGKTQCAILPTTLRAGIFARQLVGYALPTLEALDKAWHEKIAKGLNESGYGGHLPKHGPGSKGGRPAVVYFSDPETGQREGGILFMTGGAFGSTVGVVVIDDADQFQHEGVPNREAVEDILHRGDSFGEQAPRIIVGTIEFDEGSLILSTIEDSTDTRPWAQCPHCAGHQQLDWDNVVADYTSDVSAKTSARYRCNHCAVLWTEDDRRRAVEWTCVLFCDRGQRVEAGVVVGAPSQSLTFGLTWSALDSGHPGVSLGLLCYEYRLAKLALERGDHSLMRKFHRYRLCKAYTADLEQMEAGSELTWQALLVRSAASGWGPAIHTTDRITDDSGHRYSRHIAPTPSDALGLVAGEDVQADRVYWVLVAVAADGSTYDAAWGYQYARADHRPWNRQELHAMLDEVDLVMHQACDALPFLGGFIDANDSTEDVTTWTSGHAGVWYPIKGEKAKKYDGQFDLPGVVRFADDGFIRLNSGNLRDMIHAAYRRPNGASGAINLPHGLSNNSTNSAYLKHLCAEMLVVDPRTRKTRVRQGPGRWDWQDARKYAHALALLYLRDLSVTRATTENPRDPRRRPPPRPTGLTTPDGRPFLLSQR